jgi:hypothetical protein
MGTILPLRARQTWVECRGPLDQPFEERQLHRLDIAATVPATAPKGPSWHETLEGSVVWGLCKCANSRYGETVRVITKTSVRLLRLRAACLLQRTMTHTTLSRTTVPRYCLQRAGGSLAFRRIFIPRKTANVFPDRHHITTHFGANLNLWRILGGGLYCSDHSI